MNKQLRTICVFLLVSTLGFAYPLTPDIEMTPGHLCTESNSHFKEYRYQEQIPYCRRSVSSGLKRYVYELYEIPEDERQEYTIDHLIPLSVGGSNQIENLWPEHKEVKALRPNLETNMYWSIRKGETTQKETIDIILDAKFYPHGRDGSNGSEKTR